MSAGDRGVQGAVILSAQKLGMHVLTGGREVALAREVTTSPSSRVLTFASPQGKSNFSFTVVLISKDT